MCYLVTASPPSATTGIKVDHLAIFEETMDPTDEAPEVRAKQEAERLVKGGYSGVRVWKLHGTPRIEQTVLWS